MAKKEYDSIRGNYKYYAGPKWDLWTDLAEECYDLRCNCAKCTALKGLETLNSSNCKMRLAVIELVRRFGTPDENRLKKLKEKVDCFWASEFFGGLKISKKELLIMETIRKAETYTDLGGILYHETLEKIQEKLIKLRQKQYQKTYRDKHKNKKGPLNENNKKD